MVCIKHLLVSFRSSSIILFPTQLGLCTSLLLWGVQHHVHCLQCAFHIHPQQTQVPLKTAVGFLYLILVIAALPVGISFSGLRFFRFDNYIIFGDAVDSFWPLSQIFCFFMYSQVACKNAWIIQTECSKLIRSEIYLLVLGAVMPSCSLPNWVYALLSYYGAYNTMCTVCNVLFIFILNKHKVVTQYVFYISICMICAYVESNIMAVFSFLCSQFSRILSQPETHGSPYCGDWPHFDHKF